ncbi:MAG TPA: hypothetical protein VLT45_19240 [Kofleriaceae bacterium]|nr:hypothetical protein [Kofleriaceae bacterium]
MTRRARLVGGLLVACCRLAAAEPCPVLAHEQHRADRWNFAWRLALTGGTVVQGAVALVPLDRDTRLAAAVGAGESAVGAIGAWILPLRIPDDASCDRIAAVERQSFWLLHAGNLVVNTAGAVTLAEMTDWSRGAISFVLGYGVGLVEIYTMPRIHLPVTAVITPTASGWSVGVGGSF